MSTKSVWVSECGSCFDGGWWCRGCGGDKKVLSLEAYGYTELEAKEIYTCQFGGCDHSLIPCFLCNRDGKKPCTATNNCSMPCFWNTFTHLKSLPKPGKEEANSKLEEILELTTKYLKKVGEWIDTVESKEEDPFTKVEEIFSSVKPLTDPIPLAGCSSKEEKVDKIFATLKTLAESMISKDVSLETTKAKRNWNPIPVVKEPFPEPIEVGFSLFFLSFLFFP